MNIFLPEGRLFELDENKENIEFLKRDDKEVPPKAIMEARAVLCDREHNLHVDLHGMTGIIPREECILTDTPSNKEIAVISRVNKPVMFIPERYITLENGERAVLLSRKKAQSFIRENYLDRLTPGDVIDASVTRLEPFGAFCDVGAGVSALLPIDNISVSRIPHPDSRFRNGDRIKAVVKSRDEYGRLVLSHKELLGTWEENAALFSPGETVPGIVRSIEEYGIFIELTPNLAGLAEYEGKVSLGDSAGVYIKSINPQKMKIKLIIVDYFPCPYSPDASKYFIESGHISHWVYSPDRCDKKIETFF
ncbi:MAG: S1 RNA-binding domain-containing protein [Clostridiales bacterium]|nr:S1 RNA-binding domain-containing protein [Clostridiales bacterium]